MNSIENQNFKGEYLQRPISNLTESNLDKLESHCEKTIRYATRDKLLEHQITLELIVTYREMLKKIKVINKENEKLQDELNLYKAYTKQNDLQNFDLFMKQTYIDKQKVKEMIKFIEEEGYWEFTTQRDSDKAKELFQRVLED